MLLIYIIELGYNFLKKDLDKIQKFKNPVLDNNRCILERALPRARASPCAFAHTLIIVEAHLGK